VGFTEAGPDHENDLGLVLEKGKVESGRNIPVYRIVEARGNELGAISSGN